MVISLTAIPRHVVNRRRLAFEQFCHFSDSQNVILCRDCRQNLRPCGRHRDYKGCVGKHAAFVLGWAGFAETADGRFNTGDWLFAALNHIKAVESPLAEIAGNLTGQATHAFNRLSVPQQSKGCRFVLGGWQRISENPELFTGVIFNDLKYNSLAQRGEAVWTDELRPQPHSLCTLLLRFVRSNFPTTCRFSGVQSQNGYGVK